MTKINQKAGDLAITSEIKKGTRSDITDAKIRELAGLGFSQVQAGDILGCSERYIRRHHQAAWKTGVHIATVEVAKNLYKIATSDTPAAMPAAIFWMKCRGAWSEKARLELSMDLPEDYDEVKKRYAQLVEVRARALIKQGAIELPTDETAPVETTAITVTPAATTPAPVELNPAPRTKAKIF